MYPLTNCNFPQPYYISISTQLDRDTLRMTPCTISFSICMFFVINFYARLFMNLTFFTTLWSHMLTRLVWECCNLGDHQSQWERLNFDPQPIILKCSLQLNYQFDHMDWNCNDLDKLFIYTCLCHQAVYLTDINYEKFEWLLNTFLFVRLDRGALW